MVEQKPWWSKSRGGAEAVVEQEPSRRELRLGRGCGGARAVVEQELWWSKRRPGANYIYSY